jgi:hypothetical protein
MKIFKQVDLNGSYINRSDKYLLLIHFSVDNPGSVTLSDENGDQIESFQDSSQALSQIQTPAISGSENLSTGAISYNAFNSAVTYLASTINKIANQKILIPPGYAVANISAGLFLELENLDELRGLI